MLKYDFYRSWYLPSNGTIANVILHDLFIIYTNFYQAAILLVDLGWLVIYCFIFKIKNFLVMHFQLKDCTGRGCPLKICLDSHGPCHGVALVIFIDVKYFDSNFDGSKSRLKTNNQSMKIIQQCFCCI